MYLIQLSADLHLTTNQLAQGLAELFTWPHLLGLAGLFMRLHLLLEATWHLLLVLYDSNTQLHLCT